MADALLRPLNLGRKKSNTRKPHQELLIFCNGIETEKNYLESLLTDKRLPAARVKVIASGYNRLSLVHGVVEYLKSNGIDKNVKIWIVFDVDAEPQGTSNVEAIKQQVDEAQKLCDKKNFKYAISNDSFEYWLLLHFQHCDAQLHRKILIEKLSKHLEKKYMKNDDIYDVIKDKTEVAKKRAAQIACNYNKNSRISCCGPYTGMHKLVEFIEDLAQTSSTR